MPCHRPWTFPFVYQDINNSQEAPTMIIELLDKIYPTLLCAVKCPIIRPQRYSTLQKPISGYQPQVGSDRAALMNIPARTLIGQWSRPTHPGHFLHDIRANTFTAREQRLLSSRVITNASSSKPRAPSVTPPIAYATCRNPDTHGTCVSVQRSPVKRKHQPRTCSFHTASAMNRQLWLRQQELPALCAKNPNQKKNSKFNI